MSADLWSLMDIGPFGPVPSPDVQQSYKDAVALQNWQIVSTFTCETILAWQLAAKAP